MCIYEIKNKEEENLILGSLQVYRCAEGFFVCFSHIHRFLLLVLFFRDLQHQMFLLCPHTIGSGAKLHHLTFTVIDQKY